MQQLPNWDFVVMAKPGAAAAASALLRQSLDQHFERLRSQRSPDRDG